MKNENKKGFTLLEMLVVVLIIGVLAAIALPQYRKSIEKTRFADVLRRVSDMQRQSELFLMHNKPPKDGSIFITADPATFRGDNFYIGELDVTSGLICDRGNLNHMCHDDYYDFSANCSNFSWQGIACSINVSSIRRDPDSLIELELKYKNGVWTKRCDSCNGMSFLCNSLDSSYYVTNYDDLDW